MLPFVSESATACPRCRGFVIVNHGEAVCLNCGWRVHPHPPAPDDHVKSQWVASLCERCGERKALRSLEICRWCLGAATSRTKKKADAHNPVGARAGRTRSDDRSD